MSTTGVSKVDMSLDEIIKLNRKENKQKKAGRGRGGITTARGGGRRGYRVRGSKISRGGVQTYQSQGSTTGRGSAISRSQGNTRARGNLRARGRGRGRGLIQGNRAGNNKEYSTTFNTASGQARRGNLSGRRGNFRGALRGRGTKRGGLNSGGDNSLSSLQQKRQLALKALQLAHRTLANIERQTARTNFVNTKRGITAPQGESLGLQSQQLSGSTLSLTSSQGSHGRGGRGRGRQLNRHLLGTQVTSYENPKPRGRGRGWLHRSQIPASNISVSIDNPSTNTRQLLQPHSQPRRRPWRRPQQYNTSDRVVPQPSFAKDLMKLKPTESTTYVFQKNAFSAASTSRSLNERFSSVTGGQETDAAELDSSGRKVFF